MRCNSLATLLGSFFGAGCSPVVPGTIGTLAAIPLYLLMVQSNWWLYASATVLIIISGIWICEQSASELGVHDHGGIVWDEVAGYLVTMAFVPLSLTSVITGFILFRIFDIVKPWPIKWADRQVQGGWGIMLDDLIAGVFANIALWIIVLYIAP